MAHILLAALTLSLALAAPAAWAGECEDNFSKSGSVFSGVDFSSRVTVADLSVPDALAQMKGIMISEKMDVITEDADTGTMLVEQRSTNTTRAIPTLINVSDSGGGAAVEMTVKTEKGQLAKADAIRPYMCTLLARVKGRKYSLSGRVDYVQEDGEDYNVSFDVPEQGEMLLRVPGDSEPRVGVACLFRPNQLANVLTFRKGDKATFTGSFLRYDDMKRTLWLQNCVQSKQK